ncbi:YceD family protein [Yoonia sp.]|uniref:YceD family protein n=1 Tax=Yoonia sp. TaxID=2212373 RepID=UPI002FDAD198
MTDLPHHLIRLADLPNRRETTFDLQPSTTERAAVAAQLGIEGIRKLRFAGSLAPLGKRDWRLTADLGATVVQACVVTLDPVTTRLDETVTRSYLAEMPDDLTGEIEMPEDDTQDALPETLDLAAVMIEALALALPLYPRKEGAALGEAVFAQGGVVPMRDEDAKPFAGLAGLRENLEMKDE